MAFRHQRWKCYEFGSNNILATTVESGPPLNGNGISLFKEESSDIQESLQKYIPQLSLESSVFRSTWVRKDGTLFQANNAFLITGSDGMDPQFSNLNETLMICGRIYFLVLICNTVYFDSHFHAYVIDIQILADVTNMSCNKPIGSNIP